MAKFLVTTGISHHLEQLIKNADEKLMLISPYLKINDKIKEMLEYKNLHKKEVRIIYRKSDLKPEEDNWLKKLNYIRSGYCKNLHAKCYLNEKEAIITSMNLYESSQINNNEMGIYITKEGDPELYNEIYKESQRLFQISDDEKISAEKVPQKETVQSPKKKTIFKKADAPKKGFCIRCKKDIKPNPKVPYCRDCYKIWVKVRNKEFEEKYCQLCGKSNKSSLTKPSCYSCYKKYKDVLDFPLNEKK